MKKKKVKAKKKKDKYAEWKCPGCGSYDTRKRYGRMYRDLEVGQRPDFMGDYYQLICNECHLITPISERKYNRMLLKNYKHKKDE